MWEKADARELQCPVKEAWLVIGGHWKVLVVCHLFSGEKRYTELLRLLGGVPPKALTRLLREMERDGLVRRTVYAQVPPKVEYSLTSLGESLLPVVEAISAWGQTQHQRVVEKLSGVVDNRDDDHDNPQVSPLRE